MTLKEMVLTVLLVLALLPLTWHVLGDVMGGGRRGTSGDAVAEVRQKALAAARDATARADEAQMSLDLLAEARLPAGGGGPDPTASGGSGDGLGPALEVVWNLKRTDDLLDELARAERESSAELKLEKLEVLLEKARDPVVTPEFPGRSRLIDLLESRIAFWKSPPRE